jgi:tetratricopeptide (TPR) repeat protein
LVYDALGELEKSATAFESALRLDPKSAETLAYYSLVLSNRITQSEKALKMTETVLNQQGLTPLIYEILAQVLYNQQKYAEANSAIQNVLNSDPDGEVYNLAGDILNKLNKPAEAVAMWERALKAGCTDSSVKSKISEVKAQ